MNKIQSLNSQNVGTRVRLLAWLTFALAAIANTAYGADVYDANSFENPPFTVGPLVGQDGWGAPPTLSPKAAAISTDLTFTGSQSVQVRGAKLVRHDFINEATEGYYDAIGSYRRTVNYEATSTPVVRVQADVRIDGPLAPSSHNFFSAGIVAVAQSSTDPAAGVGELDISSDGVVYSHSGDALVPSFLTSRSISLGEWHTLAIDVDFAHRAYSFSVDGTALGGSYPFDTEIDTNILKRGSLVAYARPETTGVEKSDYTVNYDNFVITAQAPN